MSLWSTEAAASPTFVMRLGAAVAFTVTAALVVALQAHSAPDSLAISYLLFALALAFALALVFSLGEWARAARLAGVPRAIDDALGWLVDVLPLAALAALLVAWLVAARLLAPFALASSAFAYALSVLGVVHALLAALDAPASLVCASGAATLVVALAVPTRATSLYHAPTLASVARPILVALAGLVLVALERAPSFAVWHDTDERLARTRFAALLRWALVRALVIAIECAWLLYAHLFLAPLALVVVWARWRTLSQRRRELLLVAEHSSLRDERDDELNSGAVSAAEPRHRLAVQRPRPSTQPASPPARR